LNSFMSQAGIAARRKCDQLIKDGFVSVNTQKALDPGYIVKPEKDLVMYKGKYVTLKTNFEYILLNKPKGIVCSVKDEQKRRTVIDLIKSNRRLFPVGRLDITTTGLLIITDDGELSYRLAHPKFAVEKIYIAELHKPLANKDIRKLQKGVLIGKGEKVAAKVRIITSAQKVEITVHEGKRNMIKRMFDALGYKVVSLDRVKYAGITKRKLPRGGWRFLLSSEVKKLYTLVGLNNGD